METVKVLNLNFKAHALKKVHHKTKMDFKWEIWMKTQKIILLVGKHSAEPLFIRAIAIFGIISSSKIAETEI